MTLVQTHRLDVWSSKLRTAEPTAAAEAAAELERLGFHAIWLPGRESDPGPDAFASADTLLTATGRMVVATGVLNLWAFDAATVAARTAELVDRHSGRFVLGLGVSHAPLVEPLGFRYERPLDRMNAFLDELDQASDLAGPQHRVLAALRPGMMRLARDRSLGAHPYNTTPDHTAQARAQLGPDALLVPEQGVVLSTDAGEGRARAREFLARYLSFPNYVGNLLAYGFTAEDVEGQGSDRLVDRLVPHGPADHVLGVVQEHLDAGADRVAVQVVGADDLAQEVAAFRQLAD